MKARTRGGGRSALTDLGIWHSGNGLIGRRLAPVANDPGFENPNDAMIPLLNRGVTVKGFVQGTDRQQTTLLPECWLRHRSFLTSPCSFVRAWRSFLRPGLRAQTRRAQGPSRPAVVLS